MLYYTISWQWIKLNQNKFIATNYGEDLGLREEIILVVIYVYGQKSFF